MSRTDVISGPTATDPVEGDGDFRAAAGAILFSSATYTANGSDIVTSGTTTVTFGILEPESASQRRSRKRHFRHDHETDFNLRR